eukprot:scaffold33437_cov68-Attheya_sp.AAC.6
MLLHSMVARQMEKQSKENKFYQSHIYGNSVKLFEVPVGAGRPSCATSTDSDIILPTHGPKLKHLQGDNNSCTVCLLASALYAFGDIYASNYVHKCLTEVSELQTLNRMVYLCDLMSGHHRMKGERRLKYRATLWKNGQFDIIEHYTDVPVLCRIQDTFGATNHCVTVWQKWIFDSNFTHAFPGTLKWLNFICARRTDDGETCTAQY